MFTADQCHRDDTQGNHDKLLCSRIQAELPEKGERADYNDGYGDVRKQLGGVVIV